MAQTPVGPIILSEQDYRESVLSREQVLQDASNLSFLVAQLGKLIEKDDKSHDWTALLYRVRRAYFRRDAVAPWEAAIRCDDLARALTAAALATTDGAAVTLAIYLLSEIDVRARLFDPKIVLAAIRAWKLPRKQWPPIEALAVQFVGRVKSTDTLRVLMTRNKA